MSINSKKVLLIILIILMSIFLTSCWNSRELNTLGIVIMIGIDTEDDEILLTAEIINPTSAERDMNVPMQSRVRYVQGTGDSISDAIRNITLKLDRRIFLSHNKVFIIGEEFAKRGIVDFLDFLQRNNEHRETSYFLVAKDSKAYEVMGVNGGVNNIPGGYLLELVENYEHNGKTRSLTMTEFFKYYYDKSNQPVLGVVKSEKRAEINKVSSTPSNVDYFLNVEGGAVFNKEKLIGYYTGKEMIGFNIIVDELKRGIITFDTPNGYIDRLSTTIPPIEGDVSSTKAKEHGVTSVEILSSKTKNNIEIVDGKVHFKMKVDIKGGLAEETGDIEISNREVIKVVEKACSEEIKKQIELVLKKAQKEFKQDTFSIGALFHRKYPEEWRKISDNWNNIFSEMDYTIDVETKIIRIGLVNTPSNRIKGR
ncbi:Ger(x)C family spore germination protein [Tissierella sp. MSJ-40]|uniref:Ger(X)C family spore germination protein n=1 Tax=Tissierella simiarum TaxID=2841534 RepID=A0ABS6E9W0_9FIRM|nr:Ger(x)C family spore germination protein [Tissierella simiarum]